ncbi:hypothetical protein QLQ80_00070 [Mycoplasma sp. M5725]|uniref:ABC3 transporter permease C-terminal domain-containing protein n=1 Tax=Mycoplasma phocimorsus TaxID=3045839 RepID=A0AAJ1PRQ8_9MOLU|nr:FtsX-like permease family protein [Mycoplasma phocimorsus]MDJ1645488.1 hypothetical protein [Mycoplasma phocimorsus]
MKRLIKEVFKSLSKNKVVTIGISILVFLTSFIFTLLFNLRSSFNSQEKDIKNISRLHDITLDLNLQNTDSIKSGGYFVNNQTKDIPNIFINKQKLSNKKIILDLSKTKSDFILISSLGINNYDNLYIDKHDFKLIYDSFQLSNNLKKDQIYNFDLDKRIFSVSSKELFEKLKARNSLPKLKIFQKNANGKFVQVEKILTINYDQNIKLVEEEANNFKYNKAQVNELFDVKWENDRALFYNISNAYLNIKTKEISFNYLDIANNWINNGEAIIIDEDTSAKLFGLKKSDTYKHYYELDNSINHPIFKIANFTKENIKNFNSKLDNEVISFSWFKNNYKDKIVSEFPSSNFDDVKKIFTLNFKEKTDSLFQPNSNYIIPHNLIFNELEIDKFYQRNYRITFDEYPENWEGSLCKFIESLRSGNEELTKKFGTYQDLQKLIYWTKEKFIIRWNSLDVLNEEDIISILQNKVRNNVDVLKFDLSVQESELNEIISNIKDLKDSKTSIRQEVINFEKSQNNKTNEQILNKISDAQILNKAINNITEGAKYYKIKQIINHITNLDIEGKKIGLDNIGYRKTLSIDSFDEENNNKNVFHFVDIGDENEKVDGFKLNVGKLYNEAKNQTSIRHLKVDSDSINDSEYLPTFISAKLVPLIFSNFLSDPKYFNADLEYKKVKIKDELTNNIHDELRKIIVLRTLSNKYDKTQETNILGITKYKSKYVILYKKDNNSPWSELPETFIKDERLNLFKNRLSESDLFYFFVNLDSFTINSVNIIHNKKWLKTDEQFKNINFLPLIYRVPLNEVVDEAYTSGTSNNLIYNLEQSILKLDIVKNGYVTLEFLSRFFSELRVAFNKHNFAKVFVTAGINPSKFLPMAVELGYQLTSKYPGIFNNFIINAFTALAKNVQNVNDFNREAQELANFISTFTGETFLVNINYNVLYSSIKDVDRFLIEFSNIVNSIDFRTYFKEMKEFFTENPTNENHYKFKDENGFVREYTQIDLLKPLINSINITSLISAIGNFIDYINFDYIARQKFTLFNSSINNNLIEILMKSLIRNAKNFKLGFKELFNLFNWTSIKAVLNKHLSKLERKDLISLIASGSKVQHNKVIIPSYNTREFLSDIFKSLFENNSDDKNFKELIVRLFNFSDKTLRLTDSLFLPSSEADKLSLTDLALLLGKANETGFTLFDFEKSISDKLELYTRDKFDTNKLSEDEKKIIHYYLNINPNITPSIERSVLNNFINNINSLKILLNSYYSLKNLSLRIQQKEDYPALAKLINRIIEYVSPDFKNEIDEYKSQAAVYKFITNLIVKINNPAVAYKIARLIINIIFSNEFIQLREKLASKVIDGNNPNLPENTFGGISTWNGLVNYQQIAITFRNFIKANFEKNLLLKENIIDNNLFDQLLIPLVNYWAILVVDKQLTAKSENTYIQNQLNAINLLENSSFEIVELLNKFFIKNSTFDSFLNIFNIPSIITNKYLRKLSIGTIIWFISNTNYFPNNNNVEGNLAYIVKNKITNLNKIVNNKIEFNYLLDVLIQAIPTYESQLVSKDEEVPFSLDNGLFNYLKNSFEGNSIFGIDFQELINKSIDSVTFEQAQNTLISFNGIKSYLAKVNYAYLINNNKAIYTGKIPSNQLDMNYLIENLNSKFLININGTKFIIVGEDTTIDYLYPVIDENNISVNTSNQAIVYVNSEGFDRITNAYRGNVIKKYLLIKNETGIKNEVVKEKITTELEKIIGYKSPINRVFLNNEIDQINPERVIRISTPIKFLETMNWAIVIIISFIILMISVAITFVVRRYIGNKQKVLGILIAQGYSPIEIAKSMIIFAAITTIGSGLLGYIIGQQVQIATMEVFNNYWTLPKQAINFNIFSMIFAILVPFIGVSLLIILITTLTLKANPLELITGKNNNSWTLIQTKIAKAKKLSVKSKFISSLTLNSLPKMAAFSSSIIITSIVAVFGFISYGEFDNITNKTYEGRKFNFKLDLETPTHQGGSYTDYDGTALENQLYVPYGGGGETKLETFDYFSPGYSSVINAAENINGAISKNDRTSPHIITQFSADIKVAGLNITHWQFAYNAMPDTQKFKVDSIRDKVGYALQNAQEGIKLQYLLFDKVLKELNLKEKDLQIEENRINFIEKTKTIVKHRLTVENLLETREINRIVNNLFKDVMTFWQISKFGVYAVDKNNKKTDFFIYINNENEKAFKFAKYSPERDDYEYMNIESTSSTTIIRNKYRNFLVKAYRNIANANYSENKYSINNIFKIQEKIKDYYISFGGIYFDKNYDEKYTYVDTTYSVDNSINKLRLYGYKNDSKLFELDETLKAELNQYQGNNYPILVNTVTQRKFNFQIGDTIQVVVNNNINRFTKLLNSQENTEQKITLEIVGINNTYIKDELIILKKDADKIIGFDQFKPEQRFNGVISANKIPEQLIGTSSLYSNSGYWPALDSFTIKDNPEKIFANIFGIKDKKGNWVGNNVFKKYGFSLAQVEKFLNKDLNEALKNSGVAIKAFTKVFEEKLYFPSASSIDAKNIELGFITSIQSTIEKLIISSLLISLLLSIIILVIISSIIINENQRNIALLSILGYNKRERIRMIFSAFVPFIVIAILISVPITVILANAFVNLMLNLGNIYIPLLLTFSSVLIVSIFIILAIGITLYTSWITINKAKALDIMKGK